VFRRIVLKNAYNRRKMFEELLESVPLLKSLNVRLTPVVKCSLFSTRSRLFLTFSRSWARARGAPAIEITAVTSSGHMTPSLTSPNDSVWPLSYRLPVVKERSQVK